MSLSKGNDWFWEIVLMAEIKTVFCNLGNESEAPT